MEYYIVDMREEWKCGPCITLWRPNDAGYAYPLPWAGRYDKATVDSRGSYYTKRRYGRAKTLDRFPVPCAVVEALAVQPKRGLIDGDVGPVLLNDGPTRAALRRAKYIDNLAPLSPSPADQVMMGRMGR